MSKKKQTDTVEYTNTHTYPVAVTNADGDEEVLQQGDSTDIPADGRLAQTLPNAKPSKKKGEKAEDEDTD